MPVRRGILTAGSWVVDNNKTLQAWPAEDTMNTYVELDRQGGGSGCNMAIDLKKLDPSFHVETMAIVGDDDDGRYLLGQCDQYGIQRRHMQVIKGGTTPFSDCFNSIESGKRTHLYYPGVAEELSPIISILVTLTPGFCISAFRARTRGWMLPGARIRPDGRRC